MWRDGLRGGISRNTPSFSIWPLTYFNLQECDQIRDDPAHGCISPVSLSLTLYRCCLISFVYCLFGIIHERLVLWCEFIPSVKPDHNNNELNESNVHKLISIAIPKYKYLTRRIAFPFICIHHHGRLEVHTSSSSTTYRPDSDPANSHPHLHLQQTSASLAL